MKDERRFEKDGRVYVAVPRAMCDGCIFFGDIIGDSICKSPINGIKCAAISRVDGTSVIWKFESEVVGPCVGGAASIRDVLPDVYGRRAWARRVKELQEEQRAARLEPIKRFCAKLRGVNNAKTTETIRD